MTPARIWSDLREISRKYTDSKNSRREKKRAVRRSTSKSLPLTGTKARDSRRKARNTNTMKSKCTDLQPWGQVAVREQNSSPSSVQIWQPLSHHPNIKEKVHHTANQFPSSPPTKQTCQNTHFLATTPQMKLITTRQILGTNKVIRLSSPRNRHRHSCKVQKA